MSKGNVVLGYGRGAVGDLVLTRLKGQQVAKARNRHPANPRTAPQMKQRAGFVSPLKFYTRGVQNLFQFAFTDKRFKESDYNAFMRINVGGGFPLTPDEFRNAGFPALGSWVMSRGSLPGYVPIVTSPNSNNIGLYVGGITPSERIADLTEVLDQLYGVKSGDIVTFVMVRAYGVVTTPNSISVDEGAEVRWSINQFRCDFGDSTVISDRLPAIDQFTVSGKNYFGISAESAQINESTVGMAIIRSRLTTKGLMVSTSRMVCGGFVDEFVEFRNSPSEIQRVLAEWGASSAAILKGGLLE